MSAGGTLFWAAVLVAGVALLAPGLERVEPTSPAAPPTETQAARPPEPAGNGFASRELARASDGHFYAEAQVNGARVRFLIDTGASFVALRRADAQRAGIPLGSERARAMAAGGEIEVVPVVIDRLALGPLSANAVEGAVIDDLPVSLLGQSFLARVGTVEIRDDRMVLR